MKFRYKKYGPGVLRPVIPVEVVYKDRAVPYEVLVDSGADNCIFDVQIAEILGIDVTQGEKKMVWGITGVGEPYYLCAITIQVGGWPFQIQAGFLPRMARMGYGVVGQKGFFDLFVVKFDLQKEEVELIERKR